VGLNLKKIFLFNVFAVSASKYLDIPLNNLIEFEGFIIFELLCTELLGYYRNIFMSILSLFGFILLSFYNVFI